MTTPYTVEPGATGAKPGPTGTEAWPTGNEAGPTGTEAGPTGTEAGPSGAEAGPTGTEAGPSGAEVPTEATGHPAVDSVLRTLANAARLAPAEQIAEYEAVHRVLRETLSSIDG